MVVHQQHHRAALAARQHLQHRHPPSQVRDVVATALAGRPGVGCVQQAPSWAANVVLHDNHRVLDDRRGDEAEVMSCDERDICREVDHLLDRGTDVLHQIDDHLGDFLDEGQQCLETIHNPLQAQVRLAGEEGLEKVRDAAKPEAGDQVQQALQQPSNRPKNPPQRGVQGIHDAVLDPHAQHKHDVAQDALVQFQDEHRHRHVREK